MSLQEIEAHVARLSLAELNAFRQWFQEFQADSWDLEIEADVAAGRLDHLAKKADKDFEAGHCTPL